MPNPSPHAARQAKKRRSKPGDLATLLHVLQGALLKAEAVLTAAPRDSKLLEVGELAARLAALEAQVHESVPR